MVRAGGLTCRRLEQGAQDLMADNGAGTSISRIVGPRDTESAAEVRAPRKELARIPKETPWFTL